jgi:hypothetical protein
MSAALPSVGSSSRQHGDPKGTVPVWGWVLRLRERHRDSVSPVLTPAGAVHRSLPKAGKRTAPEMTGAVRVGPPPATAWWRRRAEAPEPAASAAIRRHRPR